MHQIETLVYVPVPVLCVPCVSRLTPVAHPLEDRLQQSSEALSYLQKAAHQWPRGQSVIGMIPMLDSHDPNHDPLMAL